MSKKTYDAVALFSAGLDSLLAVKVVEAQGLAVKCLHFTSPFFGHPRRVGYWRRTHGLDVTAVDAGDEFVRMMLAGPRFGFGRFFNPCVDCKILMLTRARELMEHYGARFIITGEVVGQRPMSQRQDAMNSVRNESGTRDVLLRPLCALRLEPTPMETSGLVDRERLHGFWGRGRTAQLELARAFAITDIPTPAGGCLLTEESSAKRYAPIFATLAEPPAAHFYLANVGRQYWSGTHWLAIGRDKKSNDLLSELARPEDLVFVLQGHPGPLAVGRELAGPWAPEVVADAAAFVASFSPRAVASGEAVTVAVRQAGTQRTVSVTPARTTPLAWSEPTWADAAPVRDRMDPKNHP